MDPDVAHPVVTAFRSRLFEDTDTSGYGEPAVHMEQRARAMPGFVDFKTFVASDG